MIAGFIEYLNIDSFWRLCGRSSQRTVLVDYIYKDKEWRGAGAIPRGTVAFGWDLFKTELHKYDSSGMTIMAIVAHEFAHILQFNLGYLQGVRFGYLLKSEINADFLAGYFLGVRKRRIPSLRFQKAGEFFIRFGQGGNGDPSRTHGDSRERLDAAEAGFRVAYVENKSLNDAVRAGLDYVGRLKVEEPGR